MSAINIAMSDWRWGRLNRFSCCLVLLLLLACMTLPTIEAHSVPSLSALLSDDAMPYDMSSVDEMEQIQQQSEQEQTQLIEESSPVTETHAAFEPHLHDAMTAEEQSFFSESDVDSFLEQHAAEHAAVEAELEAKAKAKAAVEAQHRAQLAAQAQAQHEAELKAELEMQQQHAAEVAQEAFEHQLLASEEAVKAEQAHEFELGLHSLHPDDLLAGASPEEVARVATKHFKDIEAAGMKALKRAEFLAKVNEHFQKAGPSQNVERKTEIKSAADETKSVFLEQRSKSRSSSTASQPWWASQAGVTSNYYHYQQGVKNSLIKSNAKGAATNAANSYSLPIGKQVSKSRLNQKKQAAVQSPVVEAYPLVPVQQQGASLAFNPYSGSNFHPELAVPVQAPKLPGYMAESQQPFAGAGYYGSGGGQGPHPGSEAFVPLPGVNGKEFGIRAREAWEKHAEEFKNDPTAFHDQENLPDYPYFPTWSRESEIGGRPDLFPKPMFNLPEVNRQAQFAAAAAYAHSNVYYPQLNRPITTPGPFVAAARLQAASPVAGISQGYVPQQFARAAGQPRLIRQVIGYPRPTAPAQSWSGATIPTAGFPQPANSNSFEEQHNYFDISQQRPTLGVPLHPLAGRNIMINSGPDKGLHPIFGGYPQYIPVPVPAQNEDVVHNDEDHESF